MYRLCGGEFHPGDTTALFPPDLSSITSEEMERYFWLIGYVRADLLALVRDLPDEELDWQSDPPSFLIRRLLWHIGNAEKRIATTCCGEFANFAYFCYTKFAR